MSGVKVILAPGGVPEKPRENLVDEFEVHLRVLNSIQPDSAALTRTKAIVIVCVCVCGVFVV